MEGSKFNSDNSNLQKKGIVCVVGVCGHFVTPVKKTLARFLSVIDTCIPTMQFSEGEKTHDLKSTIL